MYYHASDVVIEKPTFEDWVMFSKTDAAGLFANTHKGVFPTYGSNLHGFDLSPWARVADITEEFYWQIRNDPQERVRVFKTFRNLRFDAIRCCFPEGDSSLVVLNFDCILKWHLVEREEALH